MLARFARTFANVQMKYTPEGRYAYTLFNVATEAGNVDKVATDMQFLHDLFADSEEMRTFLKNPVLKSEQIMPIITAVLKGGQKETYRMIELLVNNKRLGQLDEIAREFDEYYRAKDRRETVRVVSAEKLDKKQQDQVASALKEFDTSKNFDVTYDIDPAILGGLQLFFPTAFMDLSLKTRIDRLEDECSGIGL